MRNYEMKYMIERKEKKMCVLKKNCWVEIEKLIIQISDFRFPIAITKKKNERIIQKKKAQILWILLAVFMY